MTVAQTTVVAILRKGIQVQIVDLEAGWAYFSIVWQDVNIKQLSPFTVAKFRINIIVEDES